MADSPLTIETDPQSGALRRVYDPSLQMEILRYDEGAELSLNGAPVQTAKLAETAGRCETQTDMQVTLLPAYNAGVNLHVRRFVTLGGHGHHSGRPNSIHMRWQVRRKPMESEQVDDLDMIWQPPLEAPLRVDTLQVLGGSTPWFGPETRMRAYALGGTGPREHVSYEDGPVGEVSEYLRTRFRTTFPGQMTINGALYYHPEDERWVWHIVRRPFVGGRILHRPDGQSVQFAYFKELPVQEEIVTPDVSVHWGRGLAEAERVFAEQFDRFAEPPDWWWHTTWFWMHPFWQPGGDFDACSEGVRILSGEGGVKGFGIGGHDLPLSGRDVDPGSLRPGIALGGDEAFRDLCRTIKAEGGHSYYWFTRTGMFPGADVRDNWKVRGIDGRPMYLEPKGDRGVKINVLNCMYSGWLKYIEDTVRYLVEDLELDGLFFDSGLQPIPPDFVPREGLNCPGEAMAATNRFYEHIYRFGKRLKDDFFMWVEGISTDFRGNAFSVDSARHGLNSGHPVMHRLAHLGRRRLVWRSAWNCDVAGGFPFIQPQSDINLKPVPETWRKFARDPLNRWVSATVAERGCRHAVGVGNGVSALDEYIIAGAKAGGTIDVPQALLRGRKLVPELDHLPEIDGSEQADGTVSFELPETGGAWKMA